MTNYSHTSAPQSTHQGPGQPVGAHAPSELIDVREHGAVKNGVPQVSEKRLFMHLYVYTQCKNINQIQDAIKKSGLESVIYLDVNNPLGIGLLFMSENPQHFTGPVRELLSSEPFLSLVPCPEMTMVGRTYSLGREADLEDWLLQKPRRNAFNPDLKWVVWYPLRRKPEFELLTKEEQGKILFEHAKIGMAYGQQGLGHDIRLACYGMDKNDNEFTLGLLAPELYPLSHLVQTMRKTQQTAKYIQSLGPFFIGQVYWQSHSLIPKK